jgi:hypothetical protein
MGLWFTIAAGPRQRIFGSESRETHDHILLSQIQGSPNLEGPVPVFIFPTNRVVQLYPQALGSLFVASYDSQSYGGGIRTRLHPSSLTKRWSSLYSLGWDSVSNTVSNSSFFDADDLRSRCLATARLFVELFPRNAQCFSSRVTKRRWILKKFDVFVWLSIRVKGWLLLMWQRIFGFDKEQNNSWLTERLSAS